MSRRAYSPAKSRALGPVTRELHPTTSPVGSAINPRVKVTDPAFMSPKSRIAEIGLLLATAYKRLSLSRQNSLAGFRDSEAQSTP